MFVCWNIDLEIDQVKRIDSPSLKLDGLDRFASFPKLFKFILMPRVSVEQRVWHRQFVMSVRLSQPLTGHCSLID